MRTEQSIWWSCIRTQASGFSSALLGLWIVGPKSSLLFFSFVSPPSSLPSVSFLSGRVSSWQYLFEGLLCQRLHDPESHCECGSGQRQVQKRVLPSLGHYHVLPVKLSSSLVQLFTPRVEWSGVSEVLGNLGQINPLPSCCLGTLFWGDPGSEIRLGGVWSSQC